MTNSERVPCERQQKKSLTNKNLNSRSTYYSDHMSVLDFFFSSDKEYLILNIRNQSGSIYYLRHLLAEFSFLVITRFRFSKSLTHTLFSYSRSLSATAHVLFPLVGEYRHQMLVINFACLHIQRCIQRDKIDVL